MQWSGVCCYVFSLVSLFQTPQEVWTGNCCPVNGSSGLAETIFILLWNLCVFHLTYLPWRENMVSWNISHILCMHLQCPISWCEFWLHNFLKNMFGNFESFLFIRKVLLCWLLSIVQKYWAFENASSEISLVAVSVASHHLRNKYILMCC